MTSPILVYSAADLSSNLLGSPLHLLPREAEAAHHGLTTIALTDHDTTSGWGEAAEAAVRHRLSLVPGVEISTQHNGISVHLLAYLIDPANPDLVREMEHARASRDTRMVRMVEKMASAGIPVTMETVLAQAERGATLGRPHIADALIEAGLVRDRNEAFEDLLHDRSPYYVHHYAPDVVRAVRLVRAAGGVPVMAHPFANRRGRTVSDEVIEEMAAAGLAGLEINHRDHFGPERAHGQALVERLGLFATGSSDFHGAGKENRLGENTTEPAVLAQIEEQASSGVTVVRP
jgi:predicted metal-dependent phosphoesterase TrpH